jgi:tetratricopeptide (TPR) repeat protein
MRARVLLAKAEYFYRAEMGDRAFVRATEHAEAAMRYFETLGDFHGQADAVHRLGLIELQRRELQPARVLFDRSLELDEQGGARNMLRGDYERHVGFLYRLAGDPDSAVPYFERSLHFRREGGLIDQAMFASETYASALVDAGHAEDAKEPALYALMLAEKFDSPVGKSRIGLALGKMYESLGDRAAAAEAYDMTLRVASAVEYDSVVRRAKEALDAMGHQNVTRE